MSDWGSLFAHALKLLAGEPAPVAIVIVLLVALSVILAVEGMRVTVTPRRILIRQLRLHAPDDGAPVSQVYQAEPAMEQPSREESARAPFRSAGSRRVQARSAPRNLLERPTDEAE